MLHLNVHQFPDGLLNCSDNRRNVSLPTKFCDKPAAGLQGCSDTTYCLLSFNHPVQSGIRENRVEGSRKREICGISQDKLEFWISCASNFNHARRAIEANHMRS